MTQQQTDAIELAQNLGSVRAAARELGIAESTLRGWLKKSDVEAVDTVTDRQTGDVREVSSKGPEIRTMEDLLEAAQVDVTVWEVAGPAEVNHWGNADKPNFQIKVKLKRIVPEKIEQCYDQFLQDIRQAAPSWGTSPLREVDEGSMVVLGLHDVHFGKLAWSPETLGPNYDLQIAKACFKNAIEDLLYRLRHETPELIVLPIGSDMFHSNDEKNRTTKGTQLDCDGRHPKVFSEVCQLLIATVLRLRQIANVKCPLVKGNHDEESSFHAAKVLEAYFHDDSAVDVDASPASRKYINYGNNLLGLMHGDKVPFNDIASLMAVDVPELWGACPYREVHVGHLHRAKEARFLTLDERRSVRVRVNPSLAAEDKFLADHGIVGARRTGEAHVYDRVEGYRTTVSVNARDE